MNEFWEPTFRIFVKVWQSFTKLLRRNVIEKDNCEVTYCSVFGYFTQAKNIQNVREFGGGVHKGRDDCRVSFMPSFETIHHHGFRFRTSLPVGLPALKSSDIRLSNVFVPENVIRIDYD